MSMWRFTTFLAKNLNQSYRSFYQKTAIAPQNILPLHKREIFHDIFPPATTDLQQLFLKKQCFYCGFDPTADSLHIGNLLTLIALLHCQRAGHDVIVVLGTATALVGDPSDQENDRNILSKEDIYKNADGIEKVINQVFGNYEEDLFENSDKKLLSQLRILRNDDWYDKLNAVEFATAIVRQFRMNFLLASRYTKERLGGENGLVASEFLYPIFQANDWLHLYENYNCKFQIGGLDQLVNIHAGHDLIKRKHKFDPHGICVPIVTNHQGKKIGKSKGNAIWLNADKTSPFELYQYFIKQPDGIVECYLKYFTFLNLNTIHEIMERHNSNKEARQAQEILAKHVCKLVHGAEGLESAQRCTRVLFEGQIDEIETLTEEEINTTFSGLVVHKALLRPDTSVLDVVLLAKGRQLEKYCQSLIAQGAVQINGCKTNIPEQILLSGLHILKNNLTLLTIGKNNHYIIKWIN